MVSTLELRSTVQDLVTRPRAQVLVIGGGINGIAVFRDLALQGVDVVLVDRADYVSGASSASSHMVHGGIRYLENGELRLVQESVTERNDLLVTAPHYVRPLLTTVPIFSTFAGLFTAPIRLITHRRGPSTERGAVLIKVGLIIYDAFSRAGRAVPRHRFAGRKSSLAQLPQLNPGIRYTASYYDASMHDPERLALDVLHDGLNAGGDRARAANYVEAAELDQGRVRLVDRTTGAEIWFEAEVVVNASGPWTDLTNSALGAPTTFMGGTKGSHLVLDHAGLLAATAGRELFFEHSDGRIVLIYPLKGRVLVGTTDLKADPSKPAEITEDEIDYFFDLVQHVFPSLSVDRSHIVFTFAGIRPLPRADDLTPGLISRDYRLERARLGSVPVISLIGGKWTTFRAVAEDLTDAVLGDLDIERAVSTRGRTIGGGAGYPVASERDSWISAHRGDLEHNRTEVLLERYGTLAARYIASLTAPEHLLKHSPAYSVEEIRRFADVEHVVHLADLVLRRTDLAFLGHLTEEQLDELARHLGAALRWAPPRRHREVEVTIAQLDSARGTVTRKRVTAGV